MSNVGPALIQVSKRDKSRESLNLEKLHKVVFYACRGITGVSASEIEIRSSFQFYSGIKTSDIQETLIKSAADLISEETPGYQYVGGKLINYHLRKIVYKQFKPWHIYKLIKRVHKTRKRRDTNLRWYGAIPRQVSSKKPSHRGNL